MKRLTKKVDGTWTAICEYGNPPYPVVTQDVIDRLAAYEDTEMTPNEILQIKKDYRSLQERLNQNNKLLNKALGRPCRSCDYGNVYCSPIGYCPFYD